MRRIKRTKITVIKTEIVFLKTPANEIVREFPNLRANDLTEEDLKEAALQLKAGRQQGEEDKEKLR